MELTSAQRIAQYRFILIINTDEWLETGGNEDFIRMLYWRMHARFGKKWVEDVKQGIVEREKTNPDTHPERQERLKRLWTL